MKKKIALLQGGFNGEVMKYVMQGIRERIAEEEADLYVFNCYGGSEEDPLYNQGEYGIFSLINCEDYDGFIMVSSNITSSSEREKQRKILCASGKPVISMEHVLDGMHYVGCRNRSAVREMTLHMIQKHQCQKIYFIGGPQDNYETQQRLLGVQDAMSESGLVMKNDWIRYYHYTYEDGYQAFHDFIENGYGLPDCVIAANDDMAIGYCAAAREQGLFAPNDFKIGGFDNSGISETYRPGITTVDRAKAEAGYKSCDILFRLMRGEEVPRLTKLKSTVKYRESCGCKDREEVFSVGCQHIIESMLTKNYMRRNIQMIHKRLVQCSGWKEYIQELEKHVPELECSAMYIMINRHEHLRPYTEKTDVQEHFDEMMSVLFAWEEGKLVEYPDLVNVRQLIPGKGKDGKNHSYLIFSIHFQEEEIGYCVIRDSFSMVDNQSLFDWSHSINMSMAIMIERLALKQANAVLDALSSEDIMTGVYNRIGITRYAERILQKDRSEKKGTLILFTDINRLKMINDVYGHEHGDIAIRTLADTLKKVRPDDAVVVRYGGDEFVMVVPGCDEQTGSELKTAIEEELVKANRRMTVPYTVSSSIGYVCAKPEDNMSMEEYVKLADGIMYHEKSLWRQQNPVIACTTREQ